MTEFKLMIEPDADDPEGAGVFVGGSIGNRPYRFLLDTGAGTSSILFDPYTATFPANDDRHQSSGVFARSNQDLITVPSLSIGKLSKADFTLVRAAKNDPHVRNLIGMDFLKDYRLHFLFNEKRVTVDDAAPDCVYHDLIVGPKYHPYVDVWFGDTKANTVWDTGASITIVDISFIQKHPELFEEAGRSTGTDSAGVSMEGAMYQMAEIRIGDHTFPSVKVGAVDLSFVNNTIEIPMDLILGYNIMNKANWVFDFPQKKWAISKFH